MLTSRVTSKVLKVLRGNSGISHKSLGQHFPIPHCPSILDIQQEQMSGSIIKSNPPSRLQHYYTSLETRIGYWALLGRTRHFGYYEPGTYSPFPIGTALRAMEEKLMRSLQLQPGAKVLDAGCGAGHVAIYLAKKDYQVVAIDITGRHVEDTERNIRLAGLSKSITVREMSYQNLEEFPNHFFEGLYTIETFVHSPDPGQALAEFFRVLKPGGRVSLFEYEHSKVPSKFKRTFELMNEYAAMPTFAILEKGVLQAMLEKAGFQNVKVQDISANIVPMLRLFFLLAYLPLVFIRLLRCEKHFINALVGVEGYRARHAWSYIVVTAEKPKE